jgi:L-methionine (R)-S-oxide reductase
LVVLKLVNNKQQLYIEIAQQVQSLLEGEKDLIANLANLSAVMYMQLPDVNWAGFYLLKGDELVLAPFQGKHACTRIPLGKGVCGTAALSREVQLIHDVHEFVGHIACDATSRSEAVLPFFKNGQLLGVMDLDSPNVGRFDQNDIDGLNQLVDILQDAIK